MFGLLLCPSWGSPAVWLFKLQFYSPLLTSGAVFAGNPLHLIAFTEQNISNSGTRVRQRVYANDCIHMPSGIPVWLHCTWEPLLSLRVDCVKKSKLTGASLSHLATHFLAHTDMFALGLTNTHTCIPSHTVLSPSVTSSPPFLACEWLNHVLKCILELRGKSSGLQKFVQFFNSTPIWMHRRGQFWANSSWLKMSRAFLLLCAFGHDVDPAKQTIPELRSENAKRFACQKYSYWKSEQIMQQFIWMH